MEISYSWPPDRRNLEVGIVIGMCGYRSEEEIKTLVNEYLEKGYYDDFLSIVKL